MQRPKLAAAEMCTADHRYLVRFDSSTCAYRPVTRLLLDTLGHEESGRMQAPI